MKLIHLTHAKPGMKLAESIFDEKGTLLLARDMEITVRYIVRLENLGITAIYVKDDRLNDVKPKDLVSFGIKSKALQTLYKNFFSIKSDVESKTAKTNINLNVINFNKSEFDNLIDQILNEMIHLNEISVDLHDIKTHDNYTLLHSLNVSIISTSIAILLDYNQYQIFDLALGSLLHDIGKILIPLNILNKPGGFTPEEFEVMKTHTLKGYEILRKESSIKPVSYCITLMHHERCDGTGYPKKLNKNDIHEFSRIVAIADVYDALTSDRPYRRRLLPEEALSIIRKDNIKYDQRILELFTKHLVMFPIGSSVKLSSGEHAFIIGHHPKCPNKPIVRVVQNANMEKIPNPYDIDLFEHQDIAIRELVDYDI